jgi:multiple sugar transport system ATP-binding protein
MAAVELRRLEKRYDNGTTAIRDLSLTIGDGEMMVFVGPSGCGKSTLLRLMAGLEPVTGGEIVVDGRVVNDLPPQRRNIAMVFQNYALYPHMTVRGNIEFPLRMMRLTGGEARRRLARTAAMLELEPLLEMRPKQLSGGQRQRVAMARALVRDPAVFLLDEPLSNLDAKLRGQIRAEILSLQRRTGTTAAYVTHDQVEAMTLGDRVAVLNGGVLQQVGTAQALYEAPVNTFVAGFIGSPPMNLFRTMVRRDAPHGVTLEIGRHRVPLTGTSGYRPLPIGADVVPVIAGLRPEAFCCVDGSFRGPTIDVRVAAVENLGHEKLIFFDPPMGRDVNDGTPWVARCRPHAPAVAGTVVPLGVDTAGVVFFDPADGRALTNP